MTLKHAYAVKSLLLAFVFMLFGCKSVKLATIGEQIDLEYAGKIQGV